MDNKILLSEIITKKKFNIQILLTKLLTFIIQGSFEFGTVHTYVQNIMYILHIYPF